MAQVTQTVALYHPSGAGWGVRCEGGSTGRGDG